MSSTLRNSITASMGRSELGGGGVKSTSDLAPCELLPLPRREEPWGGREVRHNMAATPSPLQLQEEVTRRMPAPAAAMRAEVGGRRDSNGGAWRRGGGRGPWGQRKRNRAYGEHRAEEAERSLRRVLEMEWERYFFIWEDSALTVFFI
jgi:hypothetical protein